MPANLQQDLVLEHVPAMRTSGHSQRVRIGFDEVESADEASTDVMDKGVEEARFSLGVSECIETKTTTVTTRTTRKFPHVFSRNPLPLKALDVKEYPLAAKPTPRELVNVSYNLLADEDKVNTPGSEAAVAQATNQSFHKFSEECASLLHQDCDGERQTDAPSSSSRCQGRSVSPSEAHACRNRSSSKRERQIVGSSSTSVATAPQTLGMLPTSNRPRRRLNPGKNFRILNSLRPAAGCLATPDTSGLADADFVGRINDAGTTKRASQLTDTANVTLGPLSTNQSHSNYTANSPAGSETNTIYSSNVATPPITDTDFPAFGCQVSVADRPTSDIATAQDVSLPSPRLSPALAAAQSSSPMDEDDGGNRAEDIVVENALPRSRPETTYGFGSNGNFHFNSTWRPLSMPNVDDRPTTSLSIGHGQQDPQPIFVDTKNLLDVFDSMKTEMKSYMMYQFLRRCPRPTLRVVANAVNPALKCDFLLQLPIELGYLMLSYLDCRDLCRATQVSRHWRNTIDRHETGWKELFDAEGFQLAPGELQKAITQGWGWQDPVGPFGYERDLSQHSRLTRTDIDVLEDHRPPPESIKTRRQAKRKRTAYVVSERSKRRTSLLDAVMATREDTRFSEPKSHKSEGPLSAANAAILAVPDPAQGLPTLRQLHLYKSLYRRHHMIRRNWTSGDVKPKHVAFAAHPRHVITCLQFDDDKIITGSDDTLIHIYDSRTLKLRKKLEGHEGGVWALQYEGNILVSGSTDRSVRVWDIERGLCQQVFYGHTSTVRCLQILMPTKVRDEIGQTAMRPEKPLIITGSRDSQLRVWRLPEVGSRRFIQQGPPAHEADCPYFIRTLHGHGHSVRSISAHGDTLVSGSYDSTVRVWRISTGDVLHVLTGHTQKVYSVVLDHERNRCISGSMDSLVKIWDLQTGCCLHTLEGHSLLVGLLDLRDDRLVSAAADSTLRIWDPENGRCRNTLMAHTGAITCFQHDARKVISGSEKMVKMWDAQTGECIQDLLTDLSGMWQVKFDGRRCIAAVQRDSLTYVEILDFGAVRDGEPVENLGKRILLNENEVRAIIEEEA